MNPLPEDLGTIRSVAAATGISDVTIRSWIHKGKGKKKLNTYRRPGEGETLLVSQRQVEMFRIRVPRPATGPASEAHVVLDEDSTRALRHLVGLMSARLGFRISMLEAMRSSIGYMTKLEEMRAKPLGEERC